jgi:hypothetical protein
MWVKTSENVRKKHSNLKIPDDLNQNFLNYKIFLCKKNIIMVPVRHLKPQEV